RAQHPPPYTTLFRSKTDEYTETMNFADPPNEIPKGAERHATTPSAATIFGGHVWYTLARAAARGANKQYTAANVYNSRTGRTFRSEEHTSELQSLAY